MMVGQYEPSAGNKRRAAAAVHPGDRALDRLQPGIADIDAVLVFDGRTGKVVQRPHAFIGEGRNGHDCNEDQQENSLHLHHQIRLLVPSAVVFNPPLDVQPGGVMMSPVYDTASVIPLVFAKK